MKLVPSFRRHQYIKRLGIFLISAGLIAGIPSCAVETDPAPDPAPTPAPLEYHLDISSTAGGEVITPGEGTFIYEEGTEVIITAAPASGYLFDRWTGDAATVLHVSLASTSITIKGEYSITARFIRAVDYSILGKIARIEADPENGFHFAYYFYVPTSLRHLAQEGQTICILVEPNNTGFISDDQEVHDSAALRRMNWRVSYAEHLRVPLLIPTFPRPATEWRLYIQALDRNTMLSTVEAWERIDLQLLSMIDDASHRLAEIGVIPHRRVLMMGFSASGQFLTRFVVMHPDRVQAAAMGGFSWPIAPLDQWEGMALRYPVGIADLEQLTGTEFDIEQFRLVPLYLYRGDMDTNDSVRFTDGWDPEDQELIFALLGETPIERWPVAEDMYESVGCNSRFELCPGMGHEITSDMWEAVTSFLPDNMDPR